MSTRGWKDDDTKAYYQRGVAKFELAMYREAIADFDIAILQDANYKHAFLRRSEAYEQLGKFGKAKEDCSKAMTLSTSILTCHR